MEEIFIYGADLFGTVIFAVTGAVKGNAKKLDLLGIIVLSCTVGVGGGICRDCVIGALPAAAMQKSVYLILCIVTALCVFRIPGSFFRLHTHAAVIVYLDAVGLGVFTWIGCAKAASYGLPPVTVVLAGVITACGGGVIRDIFVGTIPAILKSDFYATASLLGGLLYLALSSFRAGMFLTFLAVALFVMTSRLLAYHYRVQLPKAKSFPKSE